MLPGNCSLFGKFASTQHSRITQKDLTLCDRIWLKKCMIGFTFVCEIFQTAVIGLQNIYIFHSSKEVLLVLFIKKQDSPFIIYPVEAFEGEQ